MNDNILQPITEKEYTEDANSKGVPGMSKLTGLNNLAHSDDEDEKEESFRRDNNVFENNNISSQQSSHDLAGAFNQLNNEDDALGDLAAYGQGQQLHGGTFNKNSSAQLIESMESPTTTPLEVTGHQQREEIDEEEEERKMKRVAKILKMNKDKE